MEKDTVGALEIGKNPQGAKPNRDGSDAGAGFFSTIADF
jgi:hypothetical protein